MREEKNHQLSPGLLGDGVWRHLGEGRQYTLLRMPAASLAEGGRNAHARFRVTGQRVWLAAGLLPLAVNGASGGKVECLVRPASGAMCSDFRRAESGTEVRAAESGTGAREMRTGRWAAEGAGRAGEAGRVPWPGARGALGGG